VVPNPEGQKTNPLPTSQSPFLLFILASATIFIAEILVMLFLSLLPPFSLWIQAFIDALLLISSLFPLLYIFMFRPMKLQIKQLFDTTKMCEAEIVERKKTEAALRQSERQLRYLSSQLISAQERERRRVARELHEQLGQTLAALKLRLRFIGKFLRKDQAELREEWENNLKDIDQVIEDVRHLSRDLSPSILEDLGLSTALRRLVENLARNYNLKASFDMVEIDHLFSLEDQVIMYRIFQEALNNIRKHAQATNLSIAIKQKNSNIIFMVEDDGKGFNVEQVLTDDAVEKGLGLATMEERARMLGGSLDIQSQTDKGTRITLTIPREKAGNRD